MVKQQKQIHETNSEKRNKKNTNVAYVQNNIVSTFVKKSYTNFKSFIYFF